MAVSQKAYQSLCNRFSPKRPHILLFLGQLGRLLSEPPQEKLNAILNAYGHIKKSLDRENRRSLIESLLEENPRAADFLYERILEFKENSRYGCRLFFPATGFFKYWDFDENAGLWVCLGPFLALLSPPAARVRLRESTPISDKELDDFLRALKQGISKENYRTFPEKLRLELEKMCAVAQPGLKAFLHPRFPFPLPDIPLTDEFRENAALLALEKVWDNNPSIVPQLPEYKIWLYEYSSEKLPEARFDASKPPEQIWEIFGEAFLSQIKLEPCTIPENEQLNISVDDPDTLEDF